MSALDCLCSNALIRFCWLVVEVEVVDGGLCVAVVLMFSMDVDRLICVNTVSLIDAVSRGFILISVFLFSASRSLKCFATLSLYVLHEGYGWRVCAGGSSRSGLR